MIVVISTLFSLTQTIFIYIYEMMFVCLVGFNIFGTQTTGWIPTKFGMRYPLSPVGNLKILFWADPPSGGIVLEKLNIWVYFNPRFFAPFVNEKP